MATLFRTGTRHCEMLCTATIGGGGQGDDLAWSEQVEVAWYASLGRSYHLVHAIVWGQSYKREEYLSCLEYKRYCFDS